MTDSAARSDFVLLVGERRHRQFGLVGVTALQALVVFAAFVFSGAFDLAPYADPATTLPRLAADPLPREFSRWRK